MAARLAVPSVAHKGAERASWQEELLLAPDDVAAVAQELGLPASTVLALREAAGRHRFRTTRGYLALVDRDDPRDPILAQLLPDARELLPSPPGYLDDAVGDTLPAFHPAPGLVHKYAGRALLVTTSACAVYCRFCFRRAFPYEEIADGGPSQESARAAIAADPTIHEVILSGGDPLSLPDRALARLVEGLAAIPHVRRLRVHSRMPVVLPARVTEGLLAALTATRLTPWFVTHFNHPRELTDEAIAACARLLGAGIPVLNQSVLLRGVNDDDATLATLCEALVDARIKPYYLHQLDRVHGTAHFEVPEEEAHGIVARLRARVSGIAMPSWVRDLPGAASKLPLALLLVGLLGLGGCRREEPPPTLSRSLSGVPAARESAGASSTSATLLPGGVELAADEVAMADAAPPTPEADFVLVADLHQDGRPEVFVASGSDVRFGEWPDGADAPSFSGRHRGTGMIQAMAAFDVDGDGDDEVLMAFGLGRGFAEASTEVVLLQGIAGGTVAGRLWGREGERNQVTALLPWPRRDGGADIYLAAFSSRFDVQGGILAREGGEPRWLPGHTLRMGMARAVGDFDGDGTTEVAVGRLYGDDADTPGDLRVLQEDGTVELVPTRGGVRAVGAGDLEGDRRAELLFGDGWHKDYGRQARFAPNIASRSAGGKWAVATLDTRTDNYAVERIGIVGRAVVAGGNASLLVYTFDRELGWRSLGAPEPLRLGQFAAWPDGRLVLSGASVRRVMPGPASVDVTPREEQEGPAEQQR